MAKSIFQISPVDAEIERQNARIADSDMSAPALDPISALPPLPELPRPARSSTRSPGRVAPPSDAMMRLFVDASVRHQVPLNIVMALAEQESSYNPMAVGTRTEWGRAKGLMQYLDSTAAGMGINPFDPAQAIDAAAKQLRQRLDRGYSMRDAVMEHHAGPDRKLWGPVTRRYGVEVLDRATRLKGELAPKFGNGAASDGKAALERIMAAKPPMSEAESRARDNVPDDDGWLATGTGLAKDAGNLIVSGINIAAEDLTELISRIPVMGKGITSAIDRADRFISGKGTQELFEDTEKWVDGNFTPAMRAARKKQFVLENEDGYAFGPAWSDPRTYMSGMLESLPEMVLTMGPAGRLAKSAYAGAIAKGLGRAEAARRAATVATVAGGVAEGLLGGAQSAREVRREILEMPRETLEKSEALKVLMGDGLSFEDARAALAEDASTQAFLVSGALTGMFGGLGDRALAKIITGPAKGRLKSAALGALSEGLFEEMPQSIGQQVSQNLAVRSADQTRPLGRGALNAGVTGAVIGGITGGMLGAVAPRTAIDGQHSDRGPISPPEPIAPPPAPPPPPSGPLSRAMANAPMVPHTVDVPMPVAADVPAQPVTLVTPDGEFPVELVGETPDAVWLKTSSGEELQIPRAEIDAGSVQIVGTATLEQNSMVEAPAPASATSKQDLQVDGETTPAVEQQVEQIASDAQKPEIVKAPEAANAVTEGERVDPATGEILPAAPDPEPAPAKPVAPPSSSDVAAMDEPALRARLKYLHEQARTNAGWTKPLLAERKKVEAAINQMIGLRPAEPDAPAVAAPAPQDAAMEPEPVPAPPVGEALPPTDEAVPAAQPAIVEEAAAQAAMSPLNDRPEPTQAQKDAGNYAKGHLLLGGLDISIENPAGTQRDPKWKPLQHAYGYVKRSEGADGDHVDVFLGPKADDVARPVYVVDQVNKDGSFDEHKVMIGFDSMEEARAGYLANYEDGWTGLGAITEMPFEQFKAWVRDPAQTARPIGKIARPTAAEAAPPVVEAQMPTEPAVPRGQPVPQRPTDKKNPNPYVRKGERVRFAEQVDYLGGDPADVYVVEQAGKKEAWFVNEKTGGRSNLANYRMADALRRGVMQPVVEAAAAPSERQMTATTLSGNAINERDGYTAADVGAMSPGLRKSIERIDSDVDAQRTILAAIDKSLILDGDMLAMGSPRWALERGYADIGPTDAGRRGRLTDTGRAKLAELTMPSPDQESATNPFAKNKLVTADKVEAARARLREKMNRLNSGMDPEVLVDGMTIAAAYIEAGVRKFADYAKAMRADFGERITPYLLSFWEGARHYPGLDTAGMTSPEASRAEHAALLADGLPTDEATALGTEVARPKAKKATKTPAESRKLRDDWGVEHIDGYAPIDGGKNIETDEGLKDGLKDAFLQDGLSYLRAVASLLRPLGFVPHVDAKGKEENPVRRSVGGPAVSGDVSLHMRHPERGANIYVTLGGSSMRGAVPTTKSGVALMYRVSRKDGDKQAVSGVNRWTPVDLSALDLADTIAWEVGRGTPELARDEAPAPDHSVTTTPSAVKQADAPDAAIDSEAVVAEVAEPSEKIEDFGEKLEGARKDYAQRLKERMIAARDTDIAAVPLAQSWPEPDYQKLLDTGVDAYVVAAVHALRDAIPTKPQKPWRLKGWVENVRELRDYADGLLNNTEVGEAFRALSKEPGGARAMRDIDGAIDLYLAAGHDRSLKGISLQFHHYGLYNGQPDVELWVVEARAKASAMSNWPRELAKGETRQEAIDAFVKRLQEKADIDAAPRATRFDIYTRGGKSKRVFIGKKIGREYIDFRSFDDPKAARRFLDEHRDELEADLDRFLTIPEERRASNAPRVGVDHRSGADVTPEVFADTFGFRGVQFGNYVEGDRRQADLNESFDALLDMAGVLGIPPRAISLGGALGLAFGARGRGGANAASAHYEPGTVVINLTKRRGAGSLAHEWWHALDNYFSRMGGDSAGFLTNGGPLDEAVRPEIVAAFHEVVEAINRSAIVKRSRELDRRRSKPYWSTDVEMSARAFESYIIAKLADNSQANDYLANIVDESAFGLAEGYPYPTADEMPAVRAAFDNLFQIVEARPDGDSIGLFSTLSFDLPSSPTFTATEDLRQHLVDQPYGKAIGLLLDAGKIVIHADATTLPIERNSLADAVPKPDPASQEASSSSSAPIAAEGPAKPVRRILTLRKESNNGAHAQAMTASDGVVHLVANALTSRTALPVLLHEMFHSNVRPLIGSASWSALMQRMAVLYRSAALRESGFDRPNNAYWRRALARVEAAAPPIGQEVEEFAAYAIEERALAPAGIGEIIDRMIGALKAWILRRFKVQAGAITPSQLHALAVAALRSGPNLVPARAQAAASTAPLDTYAAEIIAQLATVDDLFQNPVSTATTLSGVFADVDPTLQPVHVITSEASEKNGPFEGVLKEMRPAERVHVFRTARDRLFFVAEEGKDVWLDVSRLREGEAGSRIYAAVADYAFNTGRVFIGDPAGLSDIALRRRTEAMLASAIKHGTTKHLMPHERQTRGDSALGVPRLRWVEGDTLGNVQRMINVSLASLRNHVPEFDRARYDFPTGTFRTGEGKPLTDRALDEWADTSPRARTSGAGSSTFKRGILLNTLARTEVAGRPGLLEQSLQIPDQLVGAQARGIFYSRVVPSVDEIDAATPGFIHNLVTKAMDGRTSILGLIPLRPLISEMAARIPAAQDYLRLKQEMDALRDKWHARADEVAQPWLKFRTLHKAQNAELMDIMHDATLTGADPAEAFTSSLTKLDRQILAEGPGTEAYDAAQAKVERDRDRKVAHDRLSQRFAALPPEGQRLYRAVRDSYRKLSDAFEQALLDNLGKALDIKFAQAQRAYDAEMIRIHESSMEGETRELAFAAAEREMMKARQFHGWTKGARLTRLRHFFETNNLSGPYFPLARFGNFFVTVRDKETDQVISFSRFEWEGRQKAFAREMRAAGHDVQLGVLDDGGELRKQVDPRFVADVEAILEGEEISDAVRDAVWQRWLETMPDMSIRTSRIHRKGRAGFSTDALRAFGHHMFHGAHQLARLKYALDLDEAIALARDQAKTMRDPVRAGLIVNEIARRNQFVMNPTGGWLAQAVTSAAFVYFLAVSPAAALVNTSQTLVLGVPILAAYHGGAARGSTVATAQLARALKDFTAGRGHAANASALSAEERSAMEAAYETGLIERTQSHDLAGVGETGVAYSPVRAKVMGAISWAFHHTERFNREVTFLAAYRMARAKGEGDNMAGATAAELTWKIHFDYQNTSRPRAMQGDTAKVLFVFRNFNVNMLWRLFRDVHQAIKPDGPGARREAITQLAGTTAMMMLSAGIRGTWFFGIAMMLATLFFGDDAEEEFKKGVIDALGRRMGGMALNGVPGDLAGVDLSARIGMPDLWFRSPDRELEGASEFDYWAIQTLGAGVGALRNLWIGADMMLDGHVERGLETMAPKFVKDQLRAARYLNEGAQTLQGDPIMEDMSAADAFKQAMGFTPAELAERYDRNRAMKNKEQRILDERRKIMADYDAVNRADEDSTAVEERIDRFNAEYPDYPITPRALRLSMRSRAQMRERKAGGVYLNPKLRERLEAEAAPIVYGEEEEKEPAD